MVELNNSVFENIKHVDKNGFEYWHARELIISNNNTPPEKMKLPKKSIKEIKKYENKNKLINK